MKKLTLYLIVLLFLHGCQTHLPVVSPMEASDNIPCQTNIEQIELADIDYLLYTNRMVDAMIEDHIVQKELIHNRLKVLIQPVNYEKNTAKVNMATLNTAIKNRILRSGQFIIVNDVQSSNVQLSSVFENKKIQSDNCVDSYELFSMKLKNSRTGQMIWSDKKRFK